MQILAILSIIYLGILVAALVVSLGLILYYLLRVRSALAGVNDALQQVEERTQPLQSHLGQLYAAVGRTKDHVDEAHQALSGTG